MCRAQLPRSNRKLLWMHQHWIVICRHHVLDLMLQYHSQCWSRAALNERSLGHSVISPLSMIPVVGMSQRDARVTKTQPGVHPQKNGGTPVASPVPHVAEAETTNCSELTLQSTATNWPAQLDVHARDGSRSPSVASDRSRAIAEGRAAAAEVAEADARAQLLEVEAHLAESQAARTHLQQQIEEWQKAVAEVRGGLRDLFGSHTALVEADIPTPAAAATALIAASAQLQDLRGENSRLEHCMRDVESRAQNAEGMLLERTRECEALRSELAEVRWLLSQRDTSLACQREAVPVATPVPARRELPLGAAVVEKECSPNS